MIKNSPIK